MANHNEHPRFTLFDLDFFGCILFSHGIIPRELFDWFLGLVYGGAEQEQASGRL